MDDIGCLFCGAGAGVMGLGDGDGFGLGEDEAEVDGAVLCDGAGEADAALCNFASLFKRMRSASS